MGCNDSRKGLTQEEVALQDKETSLLLHTKYCNDLLYVFTFYAHSGLLSATGLQQALAKLSLPAPSETFLLVLEGIKQDGGYDLRRLQLICILLGAPRDDFKPSALFTLYDTQDSLCLPVSEIEAMCLDLLTTSIVDLGRLSSDIRSENYLNGLNALKREFVATMLTKIVGDKTEITKKSFVEAMSTAETAKYMMAGGLRVAVANHKRESSIGKFPKHVSSISSMAQK